METPEAQIREQRSPYAGQHHVNRREREILAAKEAEVKRCACGEAEGQGATCSACAKVRATRGARSPEEQARFEKAAQTRPISEDIAARREKLLALRARSAERGVRDEQGTAAGRPPTAMSRPAGASLPLVPPSASRAPSSTKEDGTMAKVQIGGLNLRGAAAADPAKKGENWTCACGCGAKVCQKGRFTRACAGRRRAGKDPKRPAALAVPTGIEVDPGQFGGVIPMITNRALSALSYAKSQSDAGHYDEAARVCREASAIFDAAAKLAKS